MKKTKGVLTRKVTRKECPWLKEDLPKGKVVYDYPYATYGCVSNTGVPVTLKSGKKRPFVEVPEDAVEFNYFD